jgi:DNA-binding transcriptional ArsR family regulator
MPDPPRTQPGPALSRTRVRERQTLDALLVTALSHPKRTEILTHLMHAEEPASSEQLANAVALPRRLVEYHLEVLTRAALTFEVEQKAGHAGHYYAAATAQ